MYSCMTELEPNCCLFSCRSSAVPAWQLCGLRTPPFLRTSWACGCTSSSDGCWRGCGRSCCRRQQQEGRSSGRRGASGRRAVERAEAECLRACNASVGLTLGSVYDVSSGVYVVHDVVSVQGVHLRSGRVPGRASNRHFQAGLGWWR